MFLRVKEITISSVLETKLGLKVNLQEEAAGVIITKEFTPLAPLIRATSFPIVP